MKVLFSYMKGACLPLVGRYARAFLLGMPMAVHAVVVDHRSNHSHGSTRQAHSWAIQPSAGLPACAVKGAPGGKGITWQGQSDEG